MNLETEISSDLWSAIEKPYNGNNYSHAVLDAIHFLSETIRELTGLDGDGSKLIDRAFTKDTPLLKLNKLQTETERNHQQGIALILRGIYQAIRNTRSHELIDDDQKTADAIIIFIDYLLKELNKSEESFSLSRFIQRVFDPDFVHKRKYADLLVNEIPKNKIFDTLVEVYRRKIEGDIYSVGFVIQSILTKITPEQLKQFFLIVSEELKVTSVEKIITANLHIIPPESWNDLSETARLRIENKVLKSVDEGKFVDGRIENGALATWARKHFEYFSLRKEMEELFINKVSSDDYHDMYYVVDMFFEQLPIIIYSSSYVKYCIHTLSIEVINGDQFIRRKLVSSIRKFPPQWEDYFVKELASITSKEAPEIYLSDGTPFLTMQIKDEDIPF